MKERVSLMMLAVLIFALAGNVEVYANETTTEASSIAIFEKDLITGEETSKNILISSNKSILDAESYQPEGISPNVIIGDDETIAVPEVFLSSIPNSAVGRVHVEHYDGSISEGTGFLFGPNDVATVAHVLFNSNGSIAKRVTFWLPGKGGPVAHHTGSKLAIPGEFMDNQSPNYDWGMFHINSNIGNTVGYLGWTTYVYVNDVVQVMGYPRGSSIQIMAGKQITGVEKYSISHNVDTHEGQSGAPICKASVDYKIVGIHIGGLGNLLNLGSRVTSDMAATLSYYRNE
jgi:V8-like Glu-specific endopeptidase